MPLFEEPPQSLHEEIEIDLSGFLVLPGLINAHDHLDFSLFPQLGNGPYGNWREWAADIYRPHQTPVEEHLRVPRETRFWWGGIRNLLCGVTTVSQHDRYLDHVLQSDFPVHVPSEYGWAHSVAEPEKVVERFRQTPSDWPFIVHLAEGTDQVAAKEFDLLESLVPIDERVVLVHGVGLTSAQRQRMVRSGAGLVWCPGSNLFTLGHTLSFDQVWELPNVALGTDSPLTAAGDMLDQLRFTHDELSAPASLLYELVTTKAASLLRLQSGESRLQAGSAANLFAVRDCNLTPSETLVQLSWTDIELVMQGGRVMLLSPALAGRVPSELKQGLEGIMIDGVQRLIRAPVKDLYRATCEGLGQLPRLMGRTLAPCPADSHAL